MTSQNPRADIYDPKTIAMMDEVFAAVWRMLRADEPFRDSASDTELRIAVGKKLLSLVPDGVIDPLRLRDRAVKQSASTALKGEGIQRSRKICARTIHM